MQLVAGFPPWRHGFEPGLGNVGFLVDVVAMGQVFFEYSVSLANSYSTYCSTIIIIYHLGLVH
jgi:hypothetical protein